MRDGNDHRVGFYREWASRAARQALSSVPAQTRERCSHSASMWSSIADAIEAGDRGRVENLTHNLTFLRTDYLVPSS